MVFRIVKEVEDIERFNEILLVLFEEGFEIVIEDMKLLSRIPIHKRTSQATKAKSRQSPEERLRITLERLGPTFIKFGQMLSVRPDLLPKQYTKELEKLQDGVSQFPFQKVQEIVEKELRAPINSVFSSFEKKPLASASISQVHKAVLKGGDIVAVKVQRPGIVKQMMSDIDIMRYIAKLLEKHSAKIRPFQPVRIVEEFATWTKKELDFRLEAKNAIRFAHNFEGDPIVHIPRVFLEHSSEKVIVTEFIDGIELHNIEAIKKKGIDFEKVMDNGFNAILKQVFEFGFFHADPHPGNILVMDNGSVAFVDFGIVGHFDEKLKNQAIDLLLGVLNQDPDLVLDTLSEMGMQSTVNKEELREEIKGIIDPLKYMKLREERLSSVIEQILDLAISYKLHIPPSFVLFGKTIVTLEGVALEYDPEFPIFEKARPFMEKVMLQRYSPSSQAKAAMQEVRKYKKFLQKFPEKATRALETLERGKLEIHLEDTDISRLSHEIDRSSNRIAYGMIIAGLLIASSFMIQVERGPLVFDSIPLVAFGTFVVAAVLGLVLLISIIRER